MSKSFFRQSFRALTRKRKDKQNQRGEVQNEPDGMTRLPAHAPDIPISREDFCLRRMEESCVCWRNPPKEDNRESHEKTNGCTECQA
jgi:hypothetical protein